MIPEELAYLAGIIDGEGCITLTNRAGDSTGRLARPYLGLGTTTISLVNWVRSRYPEVGYYLRKSKNSKHKACHMLVWRSDKAIAVLRQILPYLVIKKEQAKAVIDFDTFEKGFLVDNPKKGPAEPIHPDLAFARQQAWNSLREMNTRGPKH